MGPETPLPEEMLDYISRETGIDRETVYKVLKAERRYYLTLIYKGSTKPPEGGADPAGEPRGESGG